MNDSMLTDECGPHCGVDDRGRGPEAWHCAGCHDGITHGNARWESWPFGDSDEPPGWYPAGW